MWAFKFRDNSQTCRNDQNTVDIVKALGLINKEYAGKIVKTTTLYELALQNMFKDTCKLSLGAPTDITLITEEVVNITFTNSLEVVPEWLRKQELPTLCVTITINKWHRVSEEFYLPTMHNLDYAVALMRLIEDTLPMVHKWHVHNITRYESSDEQ